MYCDSAYIDDIINGIEKLISNPPELKQGESHAIYNIGNNSYEKLMTFISTLETVLSNATGETFVCKPTMPVSVGLKRFADGHVGYYGK